jgi:hexosaminidase
MNLLPRPRFLDLSGQRVANRLVEARIAPHLRPQAYELEIGQDGARLLGGDQAGLFYGRATLDQLARLHGGLLPVGTIRDHPDIAVRCAMLDISRDKVPSMQTLYEIVARLASWKINQIQLYTEHTFAYRNHPAVHAAASPLTAAEVLALDAFCARHFVELVPNQNCLGHMERWLRHPQYHELAIEPDGFFDPFELRRPPMTIDPAHPGSIALIRDLLSELLPLFRSRRVHVGLDEPWELAAAPGADFMQWVRRIRSLSELDAREMLIWGDMVASDPERARRLPPGVTVCEWGYEASHPFQERTAVLADAGVPFWVAPGTSSWLTILGRLTNMRENCCNATEAAIANGAQGYLIADWGDQGHLQQLPISDPGLAYAAAVSWCLSSNRDIDLAAALSAHCFDDPSCELATALLELGDVYRAVTPQPSNASALVLHLYHPQRRLGRGATERLSVDELDRGEHILASARERLRRAVPGRPDGAAVIDELRWSIDLVALLTTDAKLRLAGDGSLKSVAAARRRDLSAELSGLTTCYRALWQRRNRPGGLEDSVSWLENLRRAYDTGEPDPCWRGYCSAD